MSINATLIGMGAFVALVLFVLLPALLVLVSRRSQGTEKVLWVLACLFASWLGFLGFMVVTGIRARRTAQG
ncbi:hypothetical protein PVT67_03270 [Gallaecimonas kandeliae]|uniref:hypothetical protein n=1 Tax=Gallaecimonas kandeliae TaxID=3029055 RepID=UPI00264A13E9|nr:hypothetical protein [Gallaecimonas kandeliae]WKE66285.1 hypothetical protein PVT67_03270 [Gallaecimonas kandeliae]